MNYRSKSVGRPAAAMTEMPHISVTCPHCKAVISIPAFVMFIVMTCAHCNERYKLMSDGKRTEASAADPLPAKRHRFG